MNIKGDYKMSTKGAVAAVLGGLVFAGNLAATDVPATPQDLPKEKALSATNSLAGITTTQYIQLNLGKTAKASESPAVSSIPAGVSEVAWNNPDINTKEGFVITLSKLTKKPSSAYVRFAPDFEKLNENEVRMLRLAFFNSEKASCTSPERAGVIFYLAQALIQDRNAQVVVDEFNATGNLTEETFRHYMYDDAVVLTAVNLSIKIGEGAMQTSGLNQIISKERYELRIKQINDIYAVVDTKLEASIAQLRQINAALKTMNETTN